MVDGGCGGYAGGGGNGVYDDCFTYYYVIFASRNFHAIKLCYSFNN